MDKDQEQEAARDTMVEPMVGGHRVELWLKGWVEPRDRSTEAEPGCLEERAKQTGQWPGATSTAQKPKAELLARRTRKEVLSQEGWSPVESKG